MFKLLKLSLALVLSTSGAWAADTLRLEGNLEERGTQKPLSGVTVHLLPARLEAVTDTQGHFVIDAAPAGAFQWAIRLSGYSNLDQADSQEAGADNPPRRLYLEKVSYQVYETVIHGGAEKRDAKAKAVEKEEFKAPGASNDAIKAVQNLPGATTPSFFTPAMLIEGGAPEDTRYAMEGFRLPSVFHFGGFSTIIPSDALERVDFLTSGYGPEYGQALGGHVIGWTVSPSRERFQGFGFIDVFNVGGAVQGPVGEKSAYLGASRFGYVGPAASVFAQQTSLFNLTSIPVYTDGTFIFRTELSPRTTFKVVTLGSYDSLGLELKSPLKAINQANGFFRIMPELVSGAGTDTVIRVLTALGKEFVSYQDPTYFYRYDTWFLSGRFEVENQTQETWKNIWGLEFTNTFPQTTFTLPEYNKAPVSQAISSYSTFGFAPYWRTVFHAKESPWTVSPGLRADYSSLTQEFLAQPRLEVVYAVTPIWSLRTAGGLYTQVPADHLLDPSYGNPALKSERAWHLTVGTDVDFRGGSSRGLVLSGDLFYKYLDQLVAMSSVPGENFNGTGFGRALGSELLLRGEFGDFKGWLAYTFSFSTRGSATQAEMMYGYNQTQALSLIGSYLLPRNWRISSRLRGLSRPPGSPLIGGRVSGIYLPKPGSFLAEEMPIPPYLQLDIRFDKSWVYDRWILSLYLDIANVTFSRSSNGRTDLPFVPVLGAKAEF